MGEVHSQVKGMSGFEMSTALLAQVLDVSLCLAVGGRESVW